MRRVLRLCSALLAVLILVLPSGCGKSDPNKPSNPDLKVPDVPPGGRGTKNPALSPPGK